MSDAPDERLPAGDRPLGAALLLVSAGVILWEVLLTRIYSVVLYYHFAFMAVSVAMFGLTLGAMLVFLRVAPFRPADLRAGMRGLALAAGISMALSIALQLSIPLRFTGLDAPLAYLVAIYLLSAAPFVPAGAFFCLALTRFRNVGGLYGADLAGAGLACALFPAVIAWLGGPGAVLAAGACACAGAAALGGRRRPAAAVAAVLLLALAAANVSGQWLRIRYRHDGPVPDHLLESWNAFSRIVVTPYPLEIPYGWGIDPEVARQLPPVEQRWLEIDSGAGTPLTRFSGDLAELGFLRYDISSLAHHLRSGGDAYLIGTGGGRDVLTALSFGQRSIEAVEVNPNILRAVNGTFGEFTGRLDLRPEIRFAADEGRSHLERIGGTYDVIQASFVDTVAATAAGAYAFTENGLYTVEAWTSFLDHLKPDGILTFSRFYYGSTNWPVEVYRSLALAAEALRRRGVEHPGRHVILARTRNVGIPGQEAIATLLISPEPFPDADLDAAQAACERIRCDLAWSMRGSLDPAFDLLLEGPDPEDTYRRFPLDVSPPTDDRPYFFFHARIGDVLGGRDVIAYGGSAFNLPAVRLLLVLAILVLALGGVLVVLPAWRLRRLGEWPGSGTGGVERAAFFAAIGLAFMFVEIGLIQRLSLLLGHPTYGFTVVLAGLLIAGGAGSLLSERWAERVGEHRAWVALSALVPLLLALAYASGLAVTGLAGATTSVRISAALALIVPAGVGMGFAFPLGMRRVQRAADPRAPWYWGINGATSVIASVGAMLCSLALGIQATLWLGAALYLAAALLLRRL